jgi:aryl-alcohol dehydrogenase-like predicted oxidoreductase
MLRRLGRSGIQVSALGFGCWAIGGPFTRSNGGRRRAPMGWGQVDDAESIRAIHTALDHGITFFDTANNYGAGHSEAVLGMALKDRRSRVVLATKFGSIFDEAKKVHYDQPPGFVITPAFIRSSCEASLRRLQTDCIDLYQFHWGAYDETRALDVRAALEDLALEGKIRAFGWSTDQPRLAAIFADSPHCAAVQHAVNVFTPAAEMLALCARRDLASINKNPLNSGLLSGKYHRRSKFPRDDGRSRLKWNSDFIRQRLAQVDSLREALAVGGRTMAQGALAWIWAHSERTIPIPGFKHTAQALENAGALHFGPLTTDQYRAVESILGRLAEPVP